jgi:hypothetical protein
MNSQAATPMRHKKITTRLVSPVAPNNRLIDGVDSANSAPMLGT